MKNKKFKVIIGMLVFLFISIALYLVFNNKESTYSSNVDIPDSRFDDLNFYNCVKDAVGNDAVDLDGVIDNDALSSLISLDCSGKEIASTSGLELMTGLQQLDLSNNYIYTININSNTELRVLNIQKNVLVGLKIKDNTKLIALYANDNPSLVLSIPVYNNMSLKVLHLQNTNVGKNTNINNHLGHMPELEELVINSANISTLDLSNNIALKYLDASHNNIEAIDLTNNEVLEEARLSDNKISEIQVYGTNGGALKRLYLNNNLLTSLTGSRNILNTTLEELYVEDNQITNIDMYYVNLTQLWARGNRLNSTSSTSTACAYTANCNIGSHIVTFNTNDGLRGFNMNVDNTLKEPIPTKEGYVFVGWYRDQSLTEEFDEYDNITSDLTLYAKWEQSGSSSDMEEENENHGSSINPGRTSGSPVLASSGDDKPVTKPEPGSSSKISSAARDIAGATPDDDGDDGDGDYQDPEDDGDDGDGDYQDPDDDGEENEEDGDNEVPDNSQTGDSIYIALILAASMMAIGYYYAKKVR